MILPIRIAGLDQNGTAFSQLAHTLDFSRVGARIGGVQSPLRIGDEITVEYKRHRGRFRVQWVNAKPPEVGLQNVDPDRFVFFDLPEEPYKDDIDESKVRRPPLQPIAVPSKAPTGEPPSPAAKAAETVESAKEATAAKTAGTPVQLVAAASQLTDLKRKLRDIKHDVDGALQLVATTARELLAATGAAVAIKTGEEWICRASSGVAPRIGVHFQSPQGLTGQAAVSGQVVICRDTQEDRRVNPTIWRTVQLRSVASVPLMRKTEALGVLEVFADRPNAFSDDNRPLLCALGELLADVIGAANTRNH